MMTIPIETGTNVTLHFALSLEDGHVVDSNFEGKPATFTVGDGNEREFTITPENAFGQHNPQNVQAVERGNFDDDELEVGAMYSFQNGDGELPGVIVELDDKEIMVDFNHPLAGVNILFRVNILSVSPAQVH